MKLMMFFAYNPKDTDEVRLEKFAIFLVAASCCIAGVIWAAMYYLIFGWGLTALLPIIFVIIVGISLLISHKSKNHHYVIYSQIICIIYITALIQWSIGGVFDSGVVLIWAFLGPICALMFFSIRKSLFWFLLFLLNLAITILFDQFFVSHGQGVSESIRVFFFAMNLIFSSVVVFVFAGYYVNAAISERRKATRLLEANLEQEILLRQNEKLATLGKLSAGVAHELNNPAAAAQRGVEQLKDSIMNLELVEYELGQLNLSTPQLTIIEAHRAAILQRTKQPLNLDPLTRSDQEYALETWLEEIGVEDAWELAPMLVNIGYSHSELSKLTEDFKSEDFPTVAALFCNTYSTQNLLEEIGHGTARITEIIKALKSYSYLDQAPVQSVDIHEGLDDTLVMLRSMLKSGIQVQREYASDLPSIEAYGSELNQVWTNIIDNAVSAMDGKGEIVLRTKQEGSWVVVQIWDSGPGIPRDIQANIFDPFFTTKQPGEGTGLGLNISHNIVVQKHKGEMSVDSEPGSTCFTVKLPQNFENPQINS